MPNRQGKQAVILAGGVGARLRPYTTILPKPLMPIGNVPVLEIVLRQLKAHGFDRVTIAAGYLSHLLEAYFNSGARWGLRLNYHHEEKALGTAGPLADLDELDENLLVMNGDILTDLNYGALFEEHLKRNALATIATCEKRVQITLGVINADPAGMVREYIEKPEYRFSVSMGVYVYSREVISCIPRGQHFDFPQLVQELIGQGRTVATFPFEGLWYDIGRPEDYAEAQEKFPELRGRLLPDVNAGGGD